MALNPSKLYFTFKSLKNTLFTLGFLGVHLACDEPPTKRAGVTLMTPGPGQTQLQGAHFPKLVFQIRRSLVELDATTVVWALNPHKDNDPMNQIVQNIKPQEPFETQALAPETSYQLGVQVLNAQGKVVAQTKSGDVHCDVVKGQVKETADSVIPVEVCETPLGGQGLPDPDPSFMPDSSHTPAPEVVGAGGGTDATIRVIRR